LWKYYHENQLYFVVVKDKTRDRNNTLEVIEWRYGIKNVHESLNENRQVHLSFNMEGCWICFVVVVKIEEYNVEL